MKMYRYFNISIFIVIVAVMAATSLWAGGSEETRTLAVWTGYPESAPVYEAAAADYMAENPGVVIEVSSFKLTESEQKYAISLAAGTAPDLFETSHFNARRFIVDGTVASVPGSWVQNNFDKFEWEVFEYQGNVYAVPWIAGFQLLYYNKAHYREAGIGAPPTTLTELLENSRKLAKYDDNDNLVRSGVSLRLSGGGTGVAEKFDVFLYANGGSVIESVSEGKWRANIANEAGYQALNFYLQALHKYRVDSLSVKHDAEAFVNDITSQFNRETWVIGHAATNAPDLDYGIAPVAGGLQRGTNYVATGWIVPAESENQELAWDFAQYMNNDEYLVRLMGEVGWIPRKNGVDYASVFAQQEHFEQANQIPDNFTFTPSAAASSSPEVFTTFSARLVEVFGKEDLVDDRAGIMAFLEDAAGDINQILQGNDEYAQ